MNPLRNLFRIDASGEDSIRFPRIYDSRLERRHVLNAGEFVVLDTEGSTLFETDSFAKIQSQLTARENDRADRLAQAYFQRARPVDLFIETVEALWSDIAERDDWQALNAHLDLIENARKAYDWPSL